MTSSEGIGITWPRSPSPNVVHQRPGGFAHEHDSRNCGRPHGVGLAGDDSNECQSQTGPDVQSRAEHGNSTLSGNLGGGNSSGGIFNYGGTLTLTNSTVSRNTAYFGGGISHRVGGTLTITDSGNTGSSNGRGIYNYSTVALTNSTVSGNTANNQGGGIFNYGGILTLTNGTVSNNTASTGGGIYNIHEDDVVRLVNTIIANSPFGGDCGGPVAITFPWE